jgi:hypothetical protein
LSGSVNNDMPLTAVIAIAMSYAILLLHRQSTATDRPPPGRLYFLLGLLGAAAILTKANGVFVLAFLAVVLFGHFLTYRRWPATLGATAATLVGLVPLWAGWLWLNAVRMRDALGLSGSLPVNRVLALSPLDFGRLAPFLPAIWRSYWLDWSAGDVGYGPDWLYVLWGVALAIMLSGWLKRNTLRRSSLVTVLVLSGFLGITYLYLAVKALTVKEAGWLVPEARWWLPGLPALAWLAAAGFARWWPSPRRQERACLAVAAVPPLLAFGLLLFHLPALYPQAERLPVAPFPPTAVGEGSLSLTAVEIEPVIAGRPAHLILTWQALGDIDVDYTMNTQLIIRDPSGWRKIAEHNSFPGQGLNPTRGWQTGDVYRDRLTLMPEASLDGPTILTIFLSLQSPAGQTEPQVIAETVVRPAELPVVTAPLPEPVTFGETVRLIGAESGEREDRLQATLYWEATGEPPEDYAVFVHLVDEAGRLIAQADSQPLRGLSPTTRWRKGDIIRDSHFFPTGTRAGPGYRILAGLFHPITGERLPAWQAGQPLPGDAFELP